MIHSTSTSGGGGGYPVPVHGGLFPGSQGPQGQHTQNMTTNPANILYSPQSSDEKFYYESIFSIADLERQGRLSGQNAVAFMGKSELPRSTLGEIWMIVDIAKQGYLTISEFNAACRLMGLAQNGIPHTLESLRTTCQNKNIPF